MNKNGPDQQLADLIKHNGRQVAKICSQKKSEQNLNGLGNSKNVPNTFDESYIGISVDRKQVYIGDYKYLYKSEMVIQVLNVEILETATLLTRISQLNKIWSMGDKCGHTYHGGLTLTTDEDLDLTTGTK